MSFVEVLRTYETSNVNETKAFPGRVPSIKAKPKSKLKATLLWNLNLASATILVGARASSLLGVFQHPVNNIIGLYRRPITKLSVFVYSRLFSVPTLPGARLASVSVPLNT
ncbi:unnamed protein product [Cochlearia groenlandica]